MRRVKNYELETMPFDPPVITYRDRKGIHTVEVETGGLSNVEIEVFREREYTYILSWDPRFPYVGIERFLGHEPQGNLFLGKREPIENLLGKRGLDLSPMTMAKMLAQYLIDRNQMKTEK